MKLRIETMNFCIIIPGEETIIGIDGDIRFLPPKALQEETRVRSGEGLAAVEQECD